MPRIAVLPGDGIGPEVIREGIAVIKAALGAKAATWEFVEAPVGWAAIDVSGTALPDDTLRLCQESDAIFFGAVGLPDRDATLPLAERPETKALLALRRGLFANLRPAILYPEFSSFSVLREDKVAHGIDILIIRELTGGLYFGKPKGREPDASGARAIDTMVYTTGEIERIAHVAFQAARVRRKNLCSVDKANILATSQLWREVITAVSSDFPDVALRHMYVDACAMELLRNPAAFDVILTENTFGDILSDEASMLVGSLGMLPSACLGNGSLPGFYEPIHGSAPDIAGKDIANPLATILTGAMLLRYSFGLDAEAQAIEQAVKRVLRAGFRTQDLLAAGGRAISTSDMGRLVAQAVKEAQ
ncbi:MAG: 3-isopropylmalate dehydrogenase [Chloroflexi bacterium]|nr:3-isopropylmalate dehydrogenase [Chloroflexota bacterium]